MPDKQKQSDRRRRDELRERIREMLASGISQAAIARQLHRSSGTIAFYARSLGMKPKQYSERLPEKRGKRECAECHKMKLPGAFPSARNAVCTVCIRTRKKFTPYS